MFELGVIKLTDLLFGLIKYKHSNVLNLLDEIYKAFEVTHNDYMESFRNYRQLISTTKNPSSGAHPVLQEIKKDQLFLADARLKLVGLVEVHEDSLIFSKLLEKISSYLYVIGSGDIRLINGLRLVLLKDLEDVCRRNLQMTKSEINFLRKTNRIANLPPDHPFRALAHNNVPINNNHVNDVIKFEMIRRLDLFITEVQRRYAGVIQEYYLVKQRLT